MKAEIMYVKTQIQKIHLFTKSIKVQSASTSVSQNLSFAGLAPVYVNPVSFVSSHCILHQCPALLISILRETIVYFWQSNILGYYFIVCLESNVKTKNTGLRCIQ